MRVKLAKNAGFCFGVRRAMDSVMREMEKGGNIYTYGPLIHNKTVVANLEKKGVHALNSWKEVEKIRSGTVIIRSHGAPKWVFEMLEEMGINTVDATCPFVKRIHGIVERASFDGTRIFIIGDENHPEVIGIRGWCLGEALVIAGPEDAMMLPLSDEKICVVAQTTINRNIFQESVEIIQNKGYNATVVNTICNATGERQSEAVELARECDAMIVIGDQGSSNSRKLFEICRQECELTYLVQTVRDLPPKLPKAVELVGITAGASTPNYIIEEVHNYVRTAEL